MNFFDIIKSANASLWRNKARSILTILAIFVGSFSIITVTAIHTGVNDYINQQVESIGGDGYIEIAPTATYDSISNALSGNITEYDPDEKVGDTLTISDEDLDKIRNIDGVISVKPYYIATAEYITSAKTPKKYNVTVSLIPDTGIDIDLSAGSQVTPDTTERQVLISEDYVKELGFDNNEDAIGETVTFGVKQPVNCYITPDNCVKEIDTKIVGILAPSVLSMGGGVRLNQAANNAIYDLYSEGVAEEVKNRTPMAFGEVVPAKVDDVKKELENLGFTAITIDDEVGLIRSFFDAILVVFTIFGYIALLAAAIGIINTLLMSVQERTREIGLMKALGMSPAKIFLSFSIEATLLGFWGSMLGLIISMLIGTSINSIAHQGDAFLSAFPTFQLVEYAPSTVVPIILFVMFIAFLAGTMPAHKAARKDPIEALRYE